jgi:hypothetical protein
MYTIEFKPATAEWLEAISDAQREWYRLNCPGVPGGRNGADCMPFDAETVFSEWLREPGEFQDRVRAKAR